MLWGLGTVNCKTMSLVMRGKPDEVAQKNELKKEEKEQQEELDSYGEKTSEFTKARSDTLDKINMEVNGPSGGSGGFFCSSNTLTCLQYKYVACDDLKPDVLA